MTTIAAIRKMMAADRKVTDENGLRTAHKIERDDEWCRMPAAA